MSPKEFTRRMLKISNQKLDGCIDYELNHIKMDKLLCEVLSDLGYQEGVEVFEKAKKWYA